MEVETLQRFTEFFVLAACLAALVYVARLALSARSLAKEGRSRRDPANAQSLRDDINALAAERERWVAERKASEEATERLQRALAELREEASRVE